MKYHIPVRLVSNAFLIIILLSSCKVARFFIYNFADIRDYKKFPDRKINAPQTAFKFEEAQTGRIPKAVSLEDTEIPFEEYLESNKTVAFLIIQNDTIQYEKYFYGREKTSIVPSFSMAKSITSILIGCAIDDGFIHATSDLVIKYIPELKKQGFEKLTLEHLLQMTAGLKFNESYINPLGDAATFYYGRNLRKAITKMQLEQEPGEKFSYQSGSTQLLGLVLERALMNKTVSEYLEEKIWIPLEMEYPASWSLDKKKNGLEKTFCCLNARARDFAKIGRLYMQKGKWNGKQIVSEQWVERSTKVDTTNGSVWYYQYQWWLPTKTGDFMAQGILGQYIYVHPDKNLIVVRLGKKTGDANWWQLLADFGRTY